MGRSTNRLNKFSGGSIKSPLPPQRPTDPAAQPPAPPEPEDLLAPTAPTAPPKEPAKFLRGSTYSYRIRLRGDLADEYARQALSRKMEVEELLEDRLARCSGHRDEKSVWFNAEETLRLEKLCETNFTDPATDAQKALNKLDAMTTLRVADVDFTDVLTPIDLQRLRSRCEAYGKSFDEYLRQCIVTGVRAETGQL